MNKTKIDFKVRINCMTFNHAPYIVNAMNGFCIQQTAFPYVAIIIDDASTDGEQEIISDYLHEHFDLEENNVARKEETTDYALTFARHKDNKNCFFAVFLLKYNHYSIKKEKWPYYLDFAKTPKYIALCEGDDYWTAPDKLQKQYETLETHPECTIALHRVQVVRADGTRIEGNTIPKTDMMTDTDRVTLLDFCKLQFQRNYSWSFHTTSFFFRNVISDRIGELNKNVLKNFPFGDAKIMLTSLLDGEGFYLQDIMSCYRTMTGVCAEQRRNDEYRLSVNKKAILAYRDFDDYTKGKYHKYVKMRILRAEVECKMIENKWALILPKYWPITTSKSFLKLLMLEKLQNSNPFVYKTTRTIYRKLTGRKGTQV